MHRVASYLGIIFLATTNAVYGSSPTNDAAINAQATANGRSNNVVFMNGLPVESETWDPKRETPFIFNDLGINTVVDYTRLPEQASLKLNPWSGSYWPTWLDSINYRWDGDDTLSPVEKYEKAFNVTGLKDVVSNSVGYYALFLGKNVTSCSSKSDCKQGEECASRRGRTDKNMPADKICIPAWYGICHAWAAAAASEPEPKTAVEVNGVHFDINDIKALVSVMYDISFDKMVESRFVGSRCNQPLDKLPLDQFGRVLDPKCRGLNAGSFHLAMTNLLGLNKVTFFFNRKLGHEIWNQPLISYRVVQKRELTRNAAIKSIGSSASDSDHPFSPEATKFMLYKTVIVYAKESDPRGVKGSVNYHKNMTLDYILEINASNEIIGGEWLGPSKTVHPGFLTVITKRYDDSTMFRGLLKWKLVRKLLQVSVLGKDGSL